MFFIKGKKMRFQATEDQIYQIFTNAINASKPMGFGHAHYKKKNYTVDEVKECLATTEHHNIVGSYLEADYFEGRMVKLTLHKQGDEWFIPSRENPKRDYQSWAHVYPTYKDLIASVIP
jgi:hypothetical protein